MAALLDSLGTYFDRASVCVGPKHENSIYISENGKLHKFDIDANSWSVFMATDMNRFEKISVDPVRSILYQFGEDEYIHSINLKTKSRRKSRNQYHDASHSRSLVIDGKLHVFGAWTDANRAHYIWDPQSDTESLVEMHRFDELELSKQQITPGLHYHSIVYLQRKLCVLIIQEYSTRIYSYSLQTHGCQLLSFELKEEHSINTQLIASSDERYLIHFACDSQCIWVHDMKTQEAKKSTIECPSDSKAVICTDDRRKADVLAFGFVRHCWKLMEFSRVRFPERELIELVAVYVDQQQVFILDTMYILCIAVSKIMASCD